MNDNTLITLEPAGKKKIKYGPFGTFTPPSFRVVVDLAYFFSRRK